MTLISRIINLEQKKHIFLLLLFTVTILFRLPTLFNDFYDVDELAAIVQTHEYMAGDIPGKDFKESKLPLYHAIFKAAYSIMPQNGWVLVHVFTIFIVYLTAVFIYLTGCRIQGFKTGAISSLFYGVFISSFNRHFMATNGEIVYNLPVAAGLFFFILFLDENYKSGKRIIFSFACIFSGLCAAFIKFHGIIFFIFLAFMLIIYIPYYNSKFSLKYLTKLLSILVLFFAVTILDYFTTRIFAHRLVSEITGKLIYSSVQGFNPFIFIIKYTHRQFMLASWHFAIWVPAAVLIYRFIKNKFRLESLPASACAIMLILTYLMIFGGGSRFYFHYFIAAYPALCIIGAYSLIRLNSKILKKITNKFTILMMIPAFFFFVWNVKDVIIKQFFPQAFYQEGKVLYWARAVLIGTFNDYLLPDASYKDTCEYIKSITNPEDRIFVWGDGPYLYYHSERRMGIKHLWPKTSIFRITKLYKNGDMESIKTAEQMEMNFVNMLQNKKPVLFIDTSENGLSTFYYKPTPLIEKYVKNNYSFIKEVNKIKIYKINSSFD